MDVYFLDRFFVIVCRTDTEGAIGAVLSPATLAVLAEANALIVSERAAAGETESPAPTGLVNGSKQRVAAARAKQSTAVGRMIDSFYAPTAQNGSASKRHSLPVIQSSKPGVQSPPLLPLGVSTAGSTDDAAALEAVIASADTESEASIDQAKTKTTDPIVPPPSPVGSFDPLSTSGTAPPTDGDQQSAIARRVSVTGALSGTDTALAEVDSVISLVAGLASHGQLTTAEVESEWSAPPPAAAAAAAAAVGVSESADSGADSASSSVLVQPIPTTSH